jgi:hypothetical protein
MITGIVFPVAQVLLKKGASRRNVLVLLGAWSTTKIPMLMFEYANLGARDREEIRAKADAA